MSYAILGYLKVPEEQGSWAALTALKILDGMEAGDIPIVKNTRGYIVINARLADKANIELPFEYIMAADKIIN